MNKYRYAGVLGLLVEKILRTFNKNAMTKAFKVWIFVQTFKNIPLASY